MSHPQDLSLRDQAAAVASGELDAEELLDATFARIEERDGALNSVVVRFPDEARRMEELLARARESDAELARRSLGARPAGDPDPYRTPREPAE